MYTELATAFFKATGIVASKVDSPEIKVKKKQIMKRFEQWQLAKANFEDKAKIYPKGLTSNELLGLADIVKRREILYKKAYIVFASEL